MTQENEMQTRPILPPGNGGVTAPLPAGGEGLEDRKSISVPAAQVVRDAIPTPGSIQVATPESRYVNYQEVIDHLERKKAEIHLPTKEELERERRRQKTEKFISGVSDAARSIANIIAVHNYAPNMYDGANSMSARTQSRFDREKSEREAEEERYFNYAMTIGKLKEGIEQQKYQRGRDALADKIRLSQEERAQAKAYRDERMAELNMLYMDKKISTQEYLSEKEKIDAEFRDEWWKSRIGVNESQKRKNDRYRSSSKQKGGSGRSSGSGEYTETTDVEYDGFGRRVKTTKKRVKNKPGGGKKPLPGIEWKKRE